MALRTQDKVSITYQRFLSKRTGFSLHVEDIVLRDIVYSPDSFRKYLSFTNHQMVLTYLAKCRDFLTERQQEANLELVIGDYIYFDASRVCCKETLLVQLNSHGKLMCPPLQILTDSAAGQDERAGMARLANVMVPLADVENLIPIQDAAHASAAEGAPDAPAEKGRGRGRRGRGGGRGKGRGRGGGRGMSTAHEKTQLYLRALVHSLLCVFPFVDLSPWRPSSFVVPSTPGLTRHFDEGSKAYFMWDQESKVSQWCLPAELQGTGRPGVRVLVMAADEGSEGFSLFQYLASSVSVLVDPETGARSGLRVFFIRDPNHRISNAFTAGLRANPQTIRSTMEIMMIHKYRRAPYGRGKFWSEAKEALDALLQQSSNIYAHELIRTYAISIVRDHWDHEHPPGLADDLPALKALMGEMSTMHMGRRVEMRRWLSYQQAGWDLVKIWHTLLVALIAQTAAAGKDPWAIMNAPAPKAAKNDDAERKNFIYKVAVLKHLHRTINNMILRSTLVCNKRLHSHHAGYERDAPDPKTSFNYLLVWSSWDYWVTNYVIKTFQDAFHVPKWIDFVGLSECNVCPSPLLGEQEFEPGDTHVEEAEVLFNHARNCFAVMKEMLLYAFLWAALGGPWSFVRLLHPQPRERQRQMSSMKEAWQLYLRLCASNLSLHKQYLKALFFCSWAVWREPLQIFETADWDPSSPLGLAYIASMFGHAERYEAYLNSLHVENTFNALRDNEGRGARHQVRSDSVLQSLSISTMATRLAGTNNLITLEDEDSARFSSYVAYEACFRAKEAPAEGIGADVRNVKNKASWPSTKSNLFVLNQCALMTALLMTPSEHWEGLWMAELFRHNMVFGGAKRL